MMQVKMWGDLGLKAVGQISRRNSWWDELNPHLPLHFWGMCKIDRGGGGQISSKKNSWLDELNPHLPLHFWALCEIDRGDGGQIGACAKSTETVGGKSQVRTAGK